MDHYKETFETWNTIASLYQDKFMDMDLYNATYDYICSSVSKKNAKLLEIGCGPGNITKYLLSKRPDFEILGIDIAPNMIELAKKNNPTANFVVMDCREIRTSNQHFDAVICGFCLPYLSQIECKELIINSHNLLNHNGLLYLSFVEGDPKNSEIKDSGKGKIYFQYHKLEEIIAQLNNSKFDAIGTFKVNFKRSETEFELHTIITAKKNALHN